MQSGLYERDTIAGAVAREINRLEFTPTKSIEGYAYKVAFDRAGSGAEKHICAASRDILTMDKMTRKNCGNCPDDKWAHEYDCGAPDCFRVL